MTTNEAPVPAPGRSQLPQHVDPLPPRSFENRALAVYAYAYRLTLSDTAARAALRHAAVTVRGGRPQGLDDPSALDRLRAAIGVGGLPRGGAALEPVDRARPALREADLLRTGFHRRLHALPEIERQSWLLRHTGGHDVDAIASMLQQPAERIRAALASAARTLVEGELAESGSAE